MGTDDTLMPHHQDQAVMDDLRVREIQQGLIMCTADRPWDRIPRKGVRIAHDNVREIGDGEYVATLQCGCCGHTWREELPE